MTCTIIPVGTLTIPTARDVSVSQEFAGWSHTVRVEAGTYPVVAAIESERTGAGAVSYRIHSMWAQAHGTTAHAYFAAHFGGVPHGPDRTGQAMIGKPADCAIHVATYWAGDAAAMPAGLELVPQVAIHTWQTDGAYGPVSTMSRLELAPGAAFAWIEFPRHSGSNARGAWVGSLDRAAQIAIATAVVARATARPRDIDWDLRAPIREARRLLTDEQVAARFDAALARLTSATAAQITA